MSSLAATVESRPVPRRREAPFGDAAAGERLASIDVLRGLIIFVMIFVNDVPGVAGVPAWMKHIEPPEADGMTFVDVVFPAFLFIVGMSVPFALGRRLERGEAPGRVWKHVLARTFSLLVIGVFMVNSGGMSGEGWLSPVLWTLLMYLGVVLVWGAPPPSHVPGRSTRIGLRAGGAVLLCVLAFLYRSADVSGIVEMRPYWWGILGLIGWAYLVACTAYLLLRNQTTGLLGVTVLLYCVTIADATGAFSGWTWITGWIDIGSMLGAHGAIVLSGVVAGTILLPGSPYGTPSARVRWAILYGVGLATAAALLYEARDVHPAFIINKLAATPPWCLWSSAITVWIWALVYWLVDFRKQSGGFELFRLSGQNALFAFILAPVLYALFALPSAFLPVPNLYAGLGSNFAAGFLRSIILAFVVTWVAAFLRRKEFYLKL